MTAADRPFNNQYEFAARLAEMISGLVDGPAPDLLVQLGQLAGHGHAAVPQRRLEVPQRIENAVWGIEEDERVWKGGDALQDRFPVDSLARQITQVEKRIGRE